MPAFTNAKTTIPQVFLEIMKNHEEHDRLKAPAVISWENVKRFKEIRNDFLQNLRPSAERALRWNTDKGTAK